MPPTPPPSSATVPAPLLSRFFCASSLRGPTQPDAALSRAWCAGPSTLPAACAARTWLGHLLSWAPFACDRLGACPGLALGCGWCWWCLFLRRWRGGKRGRPTYLDDVLLRLVSALCDAEWSASPAHLFANTAAASVLTPHFGTSPAVQSHAWAARSQPFSLSHLPLTDKDTLTHKHTRRRRA